MGRNRTPTSILDAKGSFITHKNRQRPHEPISDRPIGEPPTWLSVGERKVWRELVKQIPPGVLFEGDRTNFELLVRLTHLMRTDFTHMKSADKTLLLSLSSRFGMTPADRSKVTVEKPKVDALTAFLSRRPA